MLMVRQLRLLQICTGWQQRLSRAYSSCSPIWPEPPTIVSGPGVTHCASAGFHQLRTILLIICSVMDRC